MFTGGPWLCEEISYECLAGSETKYRVYVRNKEIALVSNEDDARLITAALEMHGILKTLTHPGLNRQRAKTVTPIDVKCLKDRISPEMVQYIHELLDRIEADM